jgi:hypothetical protein
LDPDPTPDHVTEPENSHPDGAPRYFFMHVMKTAGATLANQMWWQFPEGRVYGFGARGAEFITRTYLYVNPRPLACMPPERVGDFLLFGGHFPYAARSLMGDRITTITVLRNPVDRVVSFLKHAQRFHEEHRGLSLEEIYEDQWYFDRFFDNHEVKMLSMTVDEMLAHSDRDGWAAQGWSPAQIDLLRRWRERPELLTDEERRTFHVLVVDDLGTARSIYRLLGAPNTADVVVDSSRLDRALANLANVDVIGVVDEYDQFMRRLSERTGLELDSGVRHNTSDEQPAPRALLRRIEANLGPSFELYESARELGRSRS